MDKLLNRIEIFKVEKLYDAVFSEDGKRGRIVKGITVMFDAGHIRHAEIFIRGVSEIDEYAIKKHIMCELWDLQHA